MYDISSKRDAIKEAQKYLLELHYVNEIFPHIGIDGIYGEETRNAVRFFQGYNNLPISGEIDYTTWQLLYGQYRRAKINRQSENFLILEEKLPLNIGDSGSDVELVQSFINRLSEKYRGLSKININGTYSYQTADSVSRLQKIYRLPQTGVLDRNTLNIIFSDFYSEETTKQ